MSGSKISSSRDFVIVVMLEPQKVGFRFNLWPLHITLLPWFSAPDVTAVEEACSEVVDEFKPFTVRAGERAYFGAGRRLAVKLIEDSGQLKNLHKKLLSAVTEKGWEVPGRYTGDQFKPHVTQKRGRDAEGEIEIRKIYIVERLEQGYRKVVSQVEV